MASYYDSPVQGQAYGVFAQGGYGGMQFAGDGYGGNGYGGSYGGGGGGGGGRRKDRRGGRRESHGGYGDSRRNDQITKVRDTMYQLGEEDDFDAVEHLPLMANYIENQYPSMPSAVLRNFRVMTTEQPYKLVHIAALLALLLRPNAPPPPSEGDEVPLASENHEVKVSGKDVLQDLVKAFRGYLDARLWRNVRLNLHLFAYLLSANLVTPKSLLTLLQSFAAVFEEPGVTLSRGDRTAVMIIETLILAGQDLNVYSPIETDALVQAVETYAQGREAQTELTSPSGGSSQMEESFDTLVAALRDLRASGFARPTFIPRPSDLAPLILEPLPSTNADGDTGETGLPEPIDLPEVLVPPEEEDDFLGGGSVAKALADVGTVAPGKERPGAAQRRSRKRRTELGAKRVGTAARWFSESLARIATPDNVILRAILSDIIDIFEVNRKECAKILFQLPRWLKVGTFRNKQGGSFGAEEHSEEGSKAGWVLEDLLVETIISTMLLLPMAPQKELYYTSLIVEICKASPSTVAPSLGKSVRRLYASLGRGGPSGKDNMDVECIRRLADWFSVHLSNFNFSWGWKEWLPDLSLPVSHPKRAFIARVIELEVRLSYYDRIKETLPDSLVGPVLPAEAAGPSFSYEDSAHPCHSTVDELMTALRSKTPVDVMTTKLEAMKTSLLPTTEPGPDDTTVVENEAEAELLLRDMVIQSVLMIGSRSFSHFLNVVERYHTLLRSLSETPVHRQAFLSGVARFWSTSQQWCFMVIDKLLQYRIIEPTDVIDFLLPIPTSPFLPPVATQLANEQPIKHDWSRFGAWDLLRMTVEKMNGRVDQVRDRLEALERREAEESEAKRAAEAAAAAAGDEVMEDVEETTGSNETALPSSLPASLPENPLKAAAAAAAAGTTTASEARTQLETIRGEQRKGLVAVMAGLAGLVEEDMKEAVGEEEEWQAWWKRGWYKEFVRRFNVPLSTNREVIQANVFSTLPEDAYARKIWSEACALMNE